MILTLIFSYQPFLGNESAALFLAALKEMNIQLKNSELNVPFSHKINKKYSIKSIATHSNF